MSSEDKKSTYLEAVYPAENQESTGYPDKLVEQLIFKVLNMTLPQTEKLKLLDVGSGRGFQSLAFSSYFDISALDISDDTEKLFRQVGKKVTFSKCNLETEKFPLEDKSVDIIFSKSVIEHITNTDHVLSEMYRVLKPGSPLILMTPAWETQHKSFYDDYTHVSPFTKHGLKTAMMVNGFENIEVKEFYQLPFLWSFPFLKIIPLMISLLPDKWKWKNGDRTRQNKLIRFSKETMLLAVSYRK